MYEYVSCPNCGSDKIKKVNYTLWGGYLGPKLFTHVKCTDCNTKYNGKTGKSNTIPIVIYNVIAFAIVFAIYYSLV